MQDETEDPFGTYAVVVNHEEQYSIWPTEKTMPNGWRSVGKEGPKAECLTYITEVWTDMRPLSLRLKMAEAEANPPAPVEREPEAELPSLVDRLCEGDHPVAFNCRPESTARALEDRLKLGFVHVLFTGTRGGTELGIRLDPQASDWSGADFQQATGSVRVSGTLTLDGEPVRCVATIDVGTLKGTGHLEKVPAAATA